MRVLHYGSFEAVLYKCSKAKFIQNVERGNADEFSYRLLKCGFDPEESTKPLDVFHSSVASRCRRGKMPVNEDIAWYFVENADRRSIVISGVKLNLLPIIPEERVDQLIMELCQMIERDTTVSIVSKNRLYGEANVEHLAVFLADLLIYVQIGNLPPRNAYYTEREAEMIKLVEGFARGERIQILTGTGGMGKTQIALNYAYQNASVYDFVWWIDGDGGQSIASSYAQILRSLGIIVDTQDDFSIVMKFKEYFNNHKNWLLIYDNCDYLNLKDRENIKSYLPNHHNTGRIILINDVTAIDVGTFNDVTAYHFLSRRVGVDCDKYAKEIAERLRNYPLALELAGAYIVVTPGVGYEQYLRLLKEYGIEVLDSGEEEASYKYTITRIIEMTFSRIIEDRKHDQYSRAVVTLMKCFALGAGEYMPIIGYKYLDTTSYQDYGIDKIDSSILDELFALGDLCKRELSNNKLVQLAVRYSLLKPEEDGLYSIHALQKEAILNLMDEKTKKDYASVLYAAFMEYKCNGLEGYELADCHLQLYYYLDRMIHSNEGKTDMASQLRNAFLRVRRAIYMTSTAYLYFMLSDEELSKEKLTADIFHYMRNNFITIGEDVTGCYQALESFDILANANKPITDSLLGKFPDEVLDYYTSILNLICGCITYALKYDRMIIADKASIMAVEVVKLLSNDFDLSQKTESTIKIWKALQKYEVYFLGHFAMKLCSSDNEKDNGFLQTISEYIAIIESFSNEIRGDMNLSYYHKLKKAWEEKDPHYLNSGMGTMVKKMVRQLLETREKIHALEKDQNARA